MAQHFECYNQISNLKNLYKINPKYVPSDGTYWLDVKSHYGSEEQEYRNIFKRSKNKRRLNKNQHGYVFAYAGYLDIIHDQETFHFVKDENYDTPSPSALRSFITRIVDKIIDIALEENFCGITYICAIGWMLRAENVPRGPSYYAKYLTNVRSINDALPVPSNIVKPRLPEIYINSYSDDLKSINAALPVPTNKTQKNTLNVFERYKQGLNTFNDAMPGGTLKRKCRNLRTHKNYKRK